jgi:hypothetical protein
MDKGSARGSDFYLQVYGKCRLIYYLRAAVGSSTDSIVLSAGRLAAPADGDPYGVSRTDLWAVAAVDAIDRPFSPALAV